MFSLLIKCVIIVEPTIPTYSHSQLGVWNRCHYSWFLNYDQKWATLETKSYFIEGSFGHDLLMTYYKNIPLTSHAACVRMVKQRVAEYHRAAGQEPEKLKIVNTIARVVKGYLEDFAKHEDEKWKFLDAEKYVKVLLKSPKGREFFVEGYIDILAQEIATDRLHIWDHKFVGGTQHFWTEPQLLMDSQTPTYTALLQLCGIPIYGTLINQLNKYEFKNPATEDQLFRRRPIFHSETELKIRLLELGRTVDEIEDCKESGVFKRTINKECSGCFYYDPCLTLMKAPEIPVEHAMQVGFTRKTEKKELFR